MTIYLHFENKAFEIASDMIRTNEQPQTLKSHTVSDAVQEIWQMTSADIVIFQDTGLVYQRGH